MTKSDDGGAGYVERVGWVPEDQQHPKRFTATVVFPDGPPPLPAATVWRRTPVHLVLATPAPQPAADDPHGTDELVDRFAVAMKAKLRAAAEKYGWTTNWRRPDWQDECSVELARHVGKGDPLDVANFAAFAWHHGWSVAPQPAPQPAADAGAEPIAQAPLGSEEPEYVLTGLIYTAIGHLCQASSIGGMRHLYQTARLLRWHYDRRVATPAVADDAAAEREDDGATLDRLMDAAVDGDLTSAGHFAARLRASFARRATRLPEPAGNVAAAALEALRAHERWEADLILNGDWSSGTLRLTQAQHDALNEVQSKRNTALELLATPPAPTPRDGGEITEAILKLHDDWVHSRLKANGSEAFNMGYSNGALSVLDDLARLVHRLDPEVDNRIASRPDAGPEARR